MKKFIRVNINNKDCKGIAFFADSNLKSITTITQANKLIDKNSFKLQLRIKVKNIQGKKIFLFEKGIKNQTLTNRQFTTFTKALDYVSSKRNEVKEMLISNGTLKDINPIVEETTILNNEVTFLDLIDTFMETKKILLRKSTMQNYSTALYKHSKPLHSKTLKEIEISDIQNIINNLINIRADATITLYARTLYAFLKTHKAQVIQEWNKLVLPFVDNKVDYTLSLEDTKKIIYAMRGYSGTTIGNETFYQYEEIRNIFVFLLTGRRITEVLSIKYSDINLETNTYKIPSTTAKGKKELVFNLDDYLLEAIKLQAVSNNIDLNKSLPNKRLFKYTKETPRTHFQNLLKSLRLPKLRLHDIRHMLATTLVQNGISIADISMMLGHSSIAITEARYVTKNKDQATRALNSLDNLIKG